MTVRYYNSQAVETTLASAMTNTQTTMTVSATTNWPTSFPFTVIIDPDQSGLEEIVDVISLASTPANTYNIYRNGVGGQTVDGGSAVAHATGAVVKHGVSGRDFKNSRDHENASSGVHGLTGTVVGTTDMQALTNKTISGSSNTISNIAKTSITNTAVTLADTGTVTSTMIADGTIVNADINASAAIAATKIANGSVDNTEFQYLNGVTSAIQTQIDAKSPTDSPTFTGTITAPVINATTKFQWNGTDLTGLAGAWQTWTPTITGWGTSNYTLDAKYVQIGKTVHFSFIMSVTGANTGGTSLSFTLPVTARIANNCVVSTSLVSNGNQYVGMSRNTSTTSLGVFSLTTATGLVQTADLTASSPAIWKNLDAIRVNGTYEAA